MLDVTRIILVGGGNMGEALLRCWLARGLASEKILVVEPHPACARDLSDRYKVAVVDQFQREMAGQVVVLAIKPQLIEDVAPLYSSLVEDNVLFLSIAAGRTLASLARSLHQKAAIVRAMPNTPAAVGRGMTAACANSQVTPVQHALADALLAAVGDVVWVDDEAMIDAVTAVSGSGPAYVFYLVECLAAAGVAAGLPEDLAMRLARGTITGAGELLFRVGDDPSELRRRVTSPGGTTAAALTALMADDGLRPLMTEAVRRAAERARELAN